MDANKPVEFGRNATLAKLRPDMDRRKVVLEHVRTISQPKFRYYLLAGVSSLLAALGLIQNNSAVIIGAMLMAPLMGPIYGIAMALIRGNGTLLRRSLSAEVQGIIIAMALPFLIGLLPLSLEITPEMITRQHPNLLDMLVALMAGIAGTYAIIDAKVSESLAGVAIATAIMPPLATAGLMLAIGNYPGAFGAFTLFLANFITILLVANIIFWLMGFSPNYRKMDRALYIKRVSFAAVGFVVLGFYLSHSLFSIIEHRAVVQKSQQVLGEYFSEKNGAIIKDVSAIKEFNDHYRLEAMATSFGVIDPHNVAEAQELVTEATGKNIRLIIQSSSGLRVYPSVKAMKQSKQSSPTIRARQRLLELSSKHWGMKLKTVEHVMLNDMIIFMVSVEGLRSLSSEEIAEWENALIETCGEKNIHLFVRSTTSKLRNRSGGFLFGFSSSGENNSVEITKKISALRQALSVAASKRNLLLKEIYLDAKSSPNRIVAILAGVRELTEADRKALEKSAGGDYQLIVGQSHDVFLTPDGLADGKSLFTKKRREIEKDIEELSDE